MVEGRERKVKLYLCSEKNLSLFAESVCSLYIVPSKRSVKPESRVLIPPGIWNITADAKVTFVLSLQ